MTNNNNNNKNSFFELFTSKILGRLNGPVTNEFRLLLRIVSHTRLHLAHHLLKECLAKHFLQNKNDKN